MKNIKPQFEKLSNETGVSVEFLMQQALVNGLNDFKRISKKETDRKQFIHEIMKEGVAKVRARKNAGI